ncbi:Gfo/Idh/MocA family oxidoreductase [uncultured Mitsuokella sp.]|uniref:Gfo/Idh/MocA family oxidoreductase n=1 Tax=uncultured Mitsuokella sp. TaxID=453120 RepID=UPI0026098B64|nr:Gfo/Idh/MocA family oxidoreductase [uncultured Mitsuokella sp.]
MKLAILGTGMIVHDALKALAFVPEIERTAIWARSHSKESAEALAREYGIAHVYTDYEALLRETEADFVYIGLVNTAHFLYAKRALEAGKHVIVEKPFTVTGKEARILRDLAEERRLFLIEAVTTLHLPNFHVIERFLPQIGRIRSVQANFSQYSSRYDSYRAGDVKPAFDPACFGGALNDLGSYNLNFIVRLFGVPEKAVYAPNLGFNGVDTSGAALLVYEDFVATAVNAKDSESPSAILIQGEKGWIRADGTPNAIKSVTVCIDKKTQTINENAYEHRMVHEFKAFWEAYEADDYGFVRRGLVQSVAVMGLLDTLHAYAALGSLPKPCHFKEDIMNIKKTFQKLPLGIPLAASTAGTILTLFLDGSKRLHVLCGTALAVLSAAHGAQHLLKIKCDAKKLLCRGCSAREGARISLDAFCKSLTVRSAIAGRVRVGSPMLIGNEPLAAQIEAYAKTFQGVDDAVANTATGSLLITYEPEELRGVPGLAKLEAQVLRKNAR